MAFDHPKLPRLVNHRLFVEERERERERERGEREAPGPVSCPRLERSRLAARSTPAVIDSALVGRGFTPQKRLGVTLEIAHLSGFSPLQT